MNRTFFSSQWYRVADLRPRLRSQAQLHRQRFRGQTWHILQDHQSGRFHRLSPSAQLMVCLMNGRRSVDEIWSHVCGKFDDDPPSQDETIHLLAQLHGADLIHGEAPPDMAELDRRAFGQQRRSLLLKLRNPLALRLPLFDPDRFLEATAPLVRPAFGVIGLLLWLSVVGFGAVLAALHWPALSANVVDRALAAENIVLILIAYPAVKTLHELGHAYAAKLGGGEVHEIGVLFLVFMPVPYVDASSSSAFQEKWRRALVGGAGIMVELLLAAIAMIVWVNIEPGLVRAMAFNVMLIGGLSTLFFNGNPLLRFDGYYVFCDLVEIPNLGSRANAYILHLAQRHLFGLTPEPPIATRGERIWFVCYGVAAFFYRLVIIASIALFIAGKLFFIGVLLAVWGVVGMLLWPLLKGFFWLLGSPRLNGRRRRALSTIGALTAALAAAIFALPLPHATMAEGVVWTPESAAIRAGTEGWVAEILAPPDAHVEVGQPILRLDDPSVTMRIEILAAERRELQLRIEAARRMDQVQANMLREQIRRTTASLARFEERRESFTLHAGASGRLILPVARDLPGRFLRQGERVGDILVEGAPTIRAVVDEADVDLVRQRTRSVALRFAQHPALVIPARLRRELPAGQRDLPSRVLGTEGGGGVVLDPSGRDGGALEPLFQFDLQALAAPSTPLVGGRVYVRFDHGSTPIYQRLYRRLRQLFLRRFGV